MEFYFLRGLAVILLQFVHPPAHQHIWPTRIKGRRRFLQGHHFSGCNTGTTQQNSLRGSAAWTPPPFMANIQNLLSVLYEADRYNDIILPQMTNWARRIYGARLSADTQHNGVILFLSSVTIISTERTIQCCKTGRSSTLQNISCAKYEAMLQYRNPSLLPDAARISGRFWNAASLG